MGHRSNPLSVRYNLTRKWDTILPSKFNYLNDFYFKYFLLEYCFNFFYYFFIKRVTRKMSNKMVKKPEVYVKKIISNFLKLKYFKYLLFYKSLYVEFKKILLNLLLFSKILKNNNVQLIKNFLKSKKNILYYLYIYYFQILKNNKVKNLYLKSKWKSLQKDFIFKLEKNLKKFKVIKKVKKKFINLYEKILFNYKHLVKFYYKKGKIKNLKKFYKFKIFSFKKLKVTYVSNLNKKKEFKDWLNKKKWKIIKKFYIKNFLYTNYQSRISHLFSINHKISKHIKYKRRKLLFFEFYDFLLNLQKSKIFFSFCLFEKIMGNISLKFYFWLDFFESDFFNYIRFSQKRLRIKFNDLFFIKFDALKFFHQNPFNLWDVKKFDNSYENNLLTNLTTSTEIINILKYKYHYYKGILYYDYNLSRNGALYTIPDNFSNKILYLFMFYWNISQNFSNYFLRTYVYILYFFKKILYKNISKFFYFKNLNINFLLISFSYFNSFLFSKYLIYKFGKKISLGRVVFSFFKLILRVVRNLRKLKKQIKHCKFKSKKDKEQFYLTDDLVDFNGFTEILGLKILGSGRFTKKSRVKKRFFYKQGIPLNTFHANVDYALNEKILKFGIAGIKVWVYRTNSLRNTFINSF